jgi:hypothetical protein
MQRPARLQARASMRLETQRLVQLRAPASMQLRTLEPMRWQVPLEHLALQTAPPKQAALRCR